MRLTLAALLAAAFAASATPAAACGIFSCLDEAVADDLYPPGETALAPTIQEMVRERQDKGLSLAGFYNDPSFGLHRRTYERPAPSFFGSWFSAPQVYSPASPAPVFIEAPETHGDYGYASRRHGPHIIASPFGGEREGRRRVAHEREHERRHRID